MDSTACCSNLECMSQASVESPQADVFARGCPSRAVMQEITGRWAALTLAALERRTLRFGELRRRVDGVSERMLAQTLRTLERDGLVHRAVVQNIPPHVEYSLTPLGDEVTVEIVSLISTLEQAMPRVRRAQHRYDRAAGAGRP